MLYSNFLRLLCSFCGLIFFVCHQPLWCQSYPADSLNQILKTEGLEDTTRIRISFELVDLIYYKDIAQSIEVLKSLDAIIASSSIENRFQHKYSLARGYQQSYRSDSAEILINEAKALITSEEHPREFAMAQSLLGIVYEGKGDLPEAIKALKQAAPIFYELKDSFKYAVTLNSLGLVYEIQANYTAALESYLQALVIFQALDVPRGVKSLFKNIGIIKQKQKSPDEAVVYFKKAQAISKSINNVGSQAKALNDIGAIYMDLNQIDSASFYLHESAMVYEKIESEAGKSEVHNNLGKLYRLRKDPAKGIIYNEKAFDYASKLKLLKPKIFALLELGYCHQDLFRFSKADNYFNEALSIANSMEEISLQFKVEEALYKLHRKVDASKALQHYEKAISFRDSMLNKNKIEELKSIELNYEFDKERLLKDEEFKTLKIKDDLKAEKLKNQKYTIASLILFLFATILFSYLLWNNFKKKKKLAQQKNQLQEKRIIELERERKIMAMSSMIEGQESERKRIAQDLHDGLGGLLATIKIKFGIIQKELAELESLNVYQQTSTMIDEACTEVRKIAHNMMPDSLTKLGLIESVRDIAEYTSDIHIKVINLGLHTLSETQQIMLYRVIQEFLNNTRKHAIATEVIIQFSADEENSIIYLEDNGNGFDPSERNGSRGLGIKSMESRINFLGGSFELDSVIGVGTTLQIHLPKS